MRIQVDESTLWRAADAVEAAAAAVAAGRLRHLIDDVARAMPGSGSQSAAGAAADWLDEAVTALVRDLARHGEAIREAAARYADTDHALATAAASS